MLPSGEAVFTRAAHGLRAEGRRIIRMISSPSRYSALALVLTAGFGVGQWQLGPQAGFVPGASAQTADATASQTPSTGDMTHSDAKNRHLAPHDTFYTLEYVSATTDKGVEGFPPGTEVHLVSVNKEAHTLTVSDGHANVEVPPGKLTNDVDIATYARAKDQTNQAQIAAYQRAEVQAYEQYEKAAADYTAKDLEKRQQAIKDEQNREQAQAQANASAQPVDATPYNNNNGYYNEGGFGYGSPYGYFANLNVVTGNANQAQSRGQVNERNQTASGKGTLPSSQTGTQSGNSQTGTRSGGGGQAAGGKKL